MRRTADDHILEKLLCMRHAMDRFTFYNIAPAKGATSEQSPPPARTHRCDDVARTYIITFFPAKKKIFELNHTCIGKQ